MIGDAISLLDSQLCLEAALQKSSNFAGLEGPTLEPKMLLNSGSITLKEAYWTFVLQNPGRNDHETTTWNGVF